MDDDTRKALARLDQEGSLALALAGLHARKLESLARRMQAAVTGGLPADKATRRSAALRLEHAANEGLAALVSVIVQAARLDVLMTICPILEPTNKDPQ
jgi:hypothetical protein